MFSSPFKSPFQNPFPTEGAAAAEDWWLSGGISAGDCVAAYQPKGAASLAASYSNLNNPGTNDAAPGVAPTWDSVSGWIFNGLSTYLDTGLVPSSGWSAIVLFSDTVSNDRYIFGSRDASGTLFAILPNLGGASVRYGNGGTPLSKVPPLLSGVLGFAGQIGYRNGIAETGTIGAWSGGSTFSIHLGRYNRSSPTGYFSGKEQAVAFYSTVITAAQQLAVTNAMNLL